MFFKVHTVIFLEDENKLKTSFEITKRVILISKNFSFLIENQIFSNIPINIHFQLKVAISKEIFNRGKYISQHLYEPLKELLIFYLTEF